MVDTFLLGAIVGILFVISFTLAKIYGTLSAMPHMLGTIAGELEAKRRIDAVTSQIGRSRQ